MTKHGYTGSKIHKLWVAMRGRCSNPKNSGWPLYGGRGIVVCERWHDFRNFIADMGDRPSEHHSLDRINGDGNYEPGNCRWATPAEQQRNRRDSVHITYLGQTKILKDWAAHFGIHPATMGERYRKGLPLEVVFHVGKLKRAAKLTEAQAREIRHARATTKLTYLQLSSQYGVCQGTVRNAALQGDAKP